MNPLLEAVLLSWMAGVTAFVGGIAARLERLPEGELKQEVQHGIVGFGGGILVAAVAFALAPKGIENLNVFVMAALAAFGGIAFFGLDELLMRHGGSKAQFLAMLMDFVPEAIALGALFAHEPRLGLMLAVLIGAQNLPEGFNAYRELTQARSTSRSALVSLFLVGFLGPLAALLGYILLQGHPQVTAGMMTFAAGGILYLVFQVIAPLSKMQRHWAPPLGAVMGFVVGMIGAKLLG